MGSTYQWMNQEIIRDISFVLWKFNEFFVFSFYSTSFLLFFFFFFCEFKKPNVKDGIFPPSHPASFYVNWYQRWFRIQDSPYSTSTYVTVSNFLVNVDRNGHFMRSSSITRQRFIPLLLWVLPTWANIHLTKNSIETF